MNPHHQRIAEIEAEDAKLCAFEQECVEFAEELQEVVWKLRKHPIDPEFSLSTVLADNCEELAETIINIVKAPTQLEAFLAATLLKTQFKECLKKDSYRWAEFTLNERDKKDGRHESASL